MALFAGRGVRHGEQLGSPLVTAFDSGDLIEMQRGLKYAHELSPCHEALAESGCALAGQQWFQVFEQKQKGAGWYCAIRGHRLIVAAYGAREGQGKKR